jgi:hypothetical protein
MGEAVESPTVPSYMIAEVEDKVGDAMPVRGFWRLPPEIRNAVYEELLVTDCAFRLGYAISLHIQPYYTRYTTHRQQQG